LLDSLLQEITTSTPGVIWQKMSGNMKTMMTRVVINRLVVNNDNCKDTARQ